MHKSYQCIKCYGAVLRIIYCIYKIEESGFSGWPGEPHAHEEKVAKTPWMFWLTLPVAPCSSQASPCYWGYRAQPFCHHLVRFLRSLLRSRCRAIRRRRWSLLDGDVGVSLRRGPGCEEGLLQSTAWQLMPGCPRGSLVPFLVPAYVQRVGCDGAGLFWGSLVFGTCSIRTFS